MTAVLAAEYLAVGLVVLGVWHIGKMNILGQYLMAAAQILWIAVGISRELQGLALQSLVLFILTLRAIYLWKHPQKHL